MVDKITPHVPKLQDYRLELTRVDQHPSDIEKTEERLALLRSLRDALESDALPETDEGLRAWATDKVMLCNILHTDGDTASSVGFAYTEGDKGARQVIIEASEVAQPVVDELQFSAESALARWVAVDVYRDEQVRPVEDVASPILVDAA